MQPDTTDVHTLISTTAKISTAPPRSALVTRYGPDGNGVAGTGTATYGPATGGGSTVRYEAAESGGQVRSRTSIALDDGGRVRSAQSDLLDIQGQVTRKVSGDYSRLSMNVAGLPSDGSVLIRTTDKDGKPLHHTEMAYAGEALAGLTQASYDPASSALTATLAVDYGGAKCLGTRLVGGTLDLTRSRADGSVASKTASHLNEYGVPDMVETATYGRDGKTVTERLTSNYGAVTFDPLRKVKGGGLVVAAADPSGSVLGRTLFQYANGKVKRISRIAPGALLDLASVSPYPADATTGPLRPASVPDKTVEAKRPDGSLLERSEYWAIADGTGRKLPRRTVVTVFAPDGRTVVRQTDVDFSGVTFADGGVPRGGAVVATKFEGGIRTSITHVTY
ncbi:MAG: hypothetical protein NXI18_05240 [Alphaproteobacteria bacterium]|nr:hypothetical protein [Alphaproteobacteria bacterium]